MDARCGMEKSAESLWTRLFAGIPTYSPVSVTITRHTRLDEESMHRSEPTAEELARRCTKPADWMEDRCFVCSQKVEFLHGVYQTTGCTIHYGAAVTAALGLNQNTLNLVHLGPCYDAYVAVLRAGGSNCTACLNASARKPQPPKPSLDPPQMAYVSYMAQDAGSLASLLLTGDVKIGV